MQSLGTGGGGGGGRHVQNGISGSYMDAMRPRLEGIMCTIPSADVTQKSLAG